VRFKGRKQPFKVWKHSRITVMTTNACGLSSCEGLDLLIRAFIGKCDLLEISECYMRGLGEEGGLTEGTVDGDYLVRFRDQGVLITAPGSALFACHKGIVEMVKTAVEEGSIQEKGANGIPEYHPHTPRPRRADY